MKSVQEVVAKNTSEARQLYGHFLEVNSRGVAVPQYVTQLSHSQIITESMKEIDKIRDQVRWIMCQPSISVHTGNIVGK